MQNVTCQILTVHISQKPINPFTVTRARLFKILDKVIHWIRLSTGQLLIQWTARQWIKLVVQKQRLDIHWIKFCPVDNYHNSLHFQCKSNPDQKLKKKGLLSSAIFQVIFQAVQFICYDLQMIYDQSFCYLCVGAGNICLHIIFFQVIW